MSYDLLIDETFTDDEALCQSTAKGYCISSPDFKVISQKARGISKKIPCYTRIDISYTNKIDQSVISRLRKYDLVCISTDSTSSLLSITKLGVDLLQIKLEAIRHIKKHTSGMIKEKGIFIEMVVAECVGKNRILWMKSLRRLIKLRFTPQLVISSGAKSGIGLRSSAEITKMLVAFGLKERTAIRIVSNSEKVLSNAAIRRYTLNGAIANSLDEGRLKRDFILNYLAREQL